jgi:hypothetical protein
MIEFLVGLILTLLAVVFAFAAFAGAESVRKERDQ